MYDWFVDPRIMWFVMGLIFLASELIVPGVLLIFFGLGAWTIMIMLLAIDLGIFFQFLAFILISIAYLLLFRTKITALLYGKAWKLHNYPSSVQDEIVGKEVEVSEPIVPPHSGYVVLHGTFWQAKATEKIEAGTMVRIIKQEVLILTVEKIS